MIEMTVYVAVLAVVLLAATSLLTDTVGSARKVAVAGEAEAALRLASARIAYEVRRATSVESASSLFDVDAGRLMVTTASGTRLFALDGTGRLTLDSGAGAVPLTPSTASLTMFRITSMPAATAGRPASLRMMLRARNAGAMARIDATSTAETWFTLTLR